jgi:hypothetical protein
MFSAGETERERERERLIMNYCIKRKSEKRRREEVQGHDARGNLGGPCAGRSVLCPEALWLRV